MPKRKPPAEKRVWARMVNREWEINLANGEILRPFKVVTSIEAEDLASRLRVFLISFLSPVEELTGDAASIRVELDLVDEFARLESNGASLFRGTNGTEALVLEYHH